MSMSGSRSCIAVFVALVTFCETHSASAASSGVTAVLSNSEAAVGATERRLNVADSPGRSVRSNQNVQPANATKLVFAELIVPKKTAYVGEIVPVEIRLGFDPRAHPKLLEGPEISGQGFTAQKLQQSGENLETINGRSYDVVTFKTAIAAARAGKFEIGTM